jgi:hypothetical protein
MAVPVEVMQALQAVPQLANLAQTVKKKDDEPLQLGEGFVKSGKRPALPEEIKQETQG